MNFLVFSVLLEDVALGLVGDVLFNFIRSIVYVFLGWRAYQYLNKPYFSAAVLGVVLFFLDHVILKAGYILLDALVEGESQFDLKPALFGILISFFMFASIFGLISSFGIWIRKTQATKKKKGVGD